MNERTPLIQTVVVTRRQPRYPHSTLRRFCTICLACLLIVALIGFMIPLAILPVGRHHHSRDPHWRDHWHSTWSKTQSVTYSELQNILLSTPDEARLRSWTEYYSSGPHLAGKNLTQALWTRERWEEFGIKTDIVAYDVYINYPVDHRLALLKNNTVEFECSLEEDVLEEDPTTGLEDRIPTFHGYSGNGNVTAPYIFANFGTHWDYEDLVKRNISLKGKIALVKYGRVFRGLKVQRAQELGMAGVVMYSDPQEDYDITELNGYKPYPEGPARNPSSVQRGSTQFISTRPGDPTTPGYPSKPGVPRTSPDETVPRIPSIPISYRDALPLLKALNGHGPNASSFNKEWQGGGLAHKGVNYNIGPTPDNVTLNLVNVQEYVTTPIWNAIGIINGTIPDEVVVLGNHRDAWIAGGAGDPHSGSAALMEVVRSFGQALSAGWKPTRTIVFASWDGEEYGLLGSTEWVEEYLPWLNSSVVAYLNVDVAVKGTVFEAASAPLLNSLIYNITSVVPSPEGGSVRDHWDGTVKTLGTGSDYTAFQDYAGVSSLNIEYTGGEKNAVYHYHSNYDSFTWMDKYGDPTWEYHTTIAKIWALIAAKITESPLLPLKATDYANSLKDYLIPLRKRANNSSMSAHLDFHTLDLALTRLHDAAVALDVHAIDLALQVEIGVPWWQWWKKVLLALDIRKANTKFKLVERSFLYEGGLDNRNWFKHVVYGPGRWTGYAGARYPGLDESIEDGNLTNAVRWSKIIEERLAHAAVVLEE